jgi:hypothetical protein
MKSWINELFHEKARLFVGGTLPGFFASINFLWIGDPVRANLVGFLLKLLATFVLALATGLGTILSADAVKWYKKRRRAIQIKNRRNDSQKKTA